MSKRSDLIRMADAYRAAHVDRIKEINLLAWAACEEAKLQTVAYNCVLAGLCETCQKWARAIIDGEI